jgi:ribosomal protein L34E
VAAAGDELKPDAAACARCGAPFHCGVNDPQGCWCTKLPALPRRAFDATAGCLCATCLRQALRDAGMAIADRSR